MVHAHKSSAVCLHCICVSLYSTFTADTFSCRGRIYYSASSSCVLVLVLRGNFGLFSMQLKQCLKKCHGLDNNFSN